jgi:hypothetical protein
MQNRISQRKYFLILSHYNGPWGQLCLRASHRDVSTSRPIKFTLELAKDAETIWKEATPSDRVVFLKNVLWNFSLDGLNVRYDLKKPFALLSEIKLKGVSKSWCAEEDLNLHTLRHRLLRPACLPIPPSARSKTGFFEVFRDNKGSV